MVFLYLKWTLFNLSFFINTFVGEMLNIYGIN